MLLSSVQQSDSVLYMHFLKEYSFHCGFYHRILNMFLCSIVGPSCLSIPYVKLASANPTSPTLAITSLLSVCEAASCCTDRFNCDIFEISHKWCHTMYCLYFPTGHINFLSYSVPCNSSLIHPLLPDHFLWARSHTRSLTCGHAGGQNVWPFWWKKVNIWQKALDPACSRSSPDMSPSISAFLTLSVLQGLSTGP